MGNIITNNKSELLCVDFLGTLSREPRGMHNLVDAWLILPKVPKSLYAIGRPTK